MNEHCLKLPDRSFDVDLLQISFRRESQSVKFGLTIDSLLGADMVLARPPPKRVNEVSVVNW
jgi:hypothetical protein